jgi:hypothetical protein
MQGMIIELPPALTPAPVSTTIRFAFDNTDLNWCVAACVAMAGQCHNPALQVGTAIGLNSRAALL